MLEDNKILQSEIDNVKVGSVQGSRLVGTVQENKNVFDRLALLISGKVNALIDSISYSNYASKEYVDEAVVGVVAGDIDLKSYAKKSDLDALASKEFLEENYATLEAVGGKANQSTISKSVLSPDGWTALRYSFELEYPHAEYNIEIQLSAECTNAQMQAWNEAKLLGSADENVYTAKGDIPTFDIPIILEVTKK